MIAPDGARRFETRHEATVVEREIPDGPREPMFLELVEIDPGPGTGVDPWYVIRAWRQTGNHPVDVCCPLNRAQAGMLWREATGGAEIGAGERAAEERDRREMQRAKRGRRMALGLSMFFAGCGAFVAALAAVELGMYWLALASTVAGGGAMWLWAGIEEGWL